MPQRAVHVAEECGAQGDLFDDAGGRSHVDDVTHAELILDQHEHSGEEILDEALGAESECDTDDSGAGDEWTQVDVELRQRHEAGNGEDHQRRYGLEHGAQGLGSSPGALGLYGGSLVPAPGQLIQGLESTQGHLFIRFEFVLQFLGPRLLILDDAINRAPDDAPDDAGDDPGSQEDQGGLDRFDQEIGDLGQDLVLGCVVDELAEHTRLSSARILEPVCDHRRLCHGHGADDRDDAG